MNLNQLLKDINMPTEVTSLVLDYDQKMMEKVSENDLVHIYRENLELYPEETTDDFSQMKENLQDPDNIGTLWLQLKFATLAEDEYKKRGISSTIYLNSMKFFTRSMKEAFGLYGKWTHYSFERGYGQVFLRLFRLGTLEFEFVKNESPEIFIHIPSDANLGDNSRKESYQYLEIFTKKQFPTFQKAPIFCNSWLLSPTLRQFLSSSSKIRHFQNDFLLLEANTSTRTDSYQKWVFKTVGKDYQNFPEETSLQKKLKGFIQENGKIGIALGKLKKFIE